MSLLEADAGFTTLPRPTPGEAVDVVAAGLEDGALVTLFGTCTVDYDGRASSRLEAGDRHVMVKPDGTALVHTDEGHRPVNWQPPGCDHEVSVEDGRLVVTSRRQTPAERLVVRFDRLLQVSAFDVRDPADLALSGTHEDLRDRILEDPDRVEPGFRVVEAERGTSAGAVDLYGEDAGGNPVVVEIKRSRSGPEAVGQLRRYGDAVERDLADERGDSDEADVTVRGVLVAPSATDTARRLLEQDGMAFVSLAPDPDSRDG